MRIKFILLFIAFLLINNLYAQADTAAKKDTAVKPLGWYPKAVAGLNISQIAFDHWSQGGENTLTWIVNFNGSLNYFSSDGWEFKNSLILSYGRSKSESQGYRTNENEFYLTSVLSKHIGWAVDPFFSNGVQTSITTGYLYPQNVPVAVVDFFDPAYVTQSMGFTYNKSKVFDTRLGIALQETFDNKYRQYTNDTSVTRAKAFKLDTGIESVSNVQFVIAENVKMQSSLRLFTRFESLDVWDVRWETIITGKINSFLNMNFGYLIVYQKDQSLYTQRKEGLNVGFVYTLL